MTTMKLPDLSQLDHAQKDELIYALFAQVNLLTEQVSMLTNKVAVLEGQLAMNSRNSSKPPSTDGLNKPKPKSLRTTGQRLSGGQKGHEGNTLKQVAHPDHTVAHYPPKTCPTCQNRLTNQAKMSRVASRQVFDLPPMRFEVTEHQVFETQCACGTICRGEFPVAVSAQVQYGPAVLAATVHLTHHHMMPVQRTAALMGDFFGLPMSEATIIAAGNEACERLQSTVVAIGQAVIAAPIAHADETGLRVAKKLHWVHVLATSSLTWIACHAKRGKEAFTDLGLLPLFLGTLIHDGWKPYRDLPCLHGLCNVHHLRELVFVFEEMGQIWAKRLFDQLLEACHEVAKADAPLPESRIAYYRAIYAQILAEGDAANPRAPPSGKRGKTKQNKALNLIDRLRLYADDVWRFSTDKDVPFTNNIAEQVMRMHKVKQKISGCFRTKKGAENFCTVRSYLATMHKQGNGIFDVLVLTFQGNPPQPRFA